MHARWLAFIVLLGLAGCPGFGKGSPPSTLDEVPAHPTYNGEVKLILDTYCAPCHTVPPQGGAPDYFRLDRYDEDGDLHGAFFQRDRIKARACADPPSMPPGAATQPGDIERATIARWIEQGAPLGDAGDTADSGDSGE